MTSFDRDAVTQRVIEELKRLYKTKILPLEQTYRYDLFHSPYMTDAEFDSKPQVMLVGQYSVGKTSFIRYILGRDFPGQRIGPEPTTDRFVAVMDGPDERTIPGNALAVSHDLPFRGLEKFGVSFLNRFEGSQLPSQVLRNITLIDTPGVLSGEKQRVSRGYDFTQVCGWFAARADLILLLFDAHKLDISDEFRNVIESLKGNEDKIRCILNKADQVDRQKLMRVYGALMWSLGKVFKTPEVLRVYLGSFWDQPLMFEDNAHLFDMEEQDLMRDLRDLPRNSAVRKINELVKRVRICRTHAYILSYLKEQMPMIMGHAKKQKQLIDDLQKVFRSVMKKYNLAPGDFPDIDNFRSLLAEQDFSKFSALKPRLLDDLETVLGVDIPRLMEALPRSLDASVATSTEATVTGRMPLVYQEPIARKVTASASAVPISRATVEDNPWAQDEEDEGGDANPFPEKKKSSVAPIAPADPAWPLQAHIAAYSDSFKAAQNAERLVSGAAARPLLAASGLPTPVLRRIWDLADLDKDGSLDLQEYTIAMFLIEFVKKGNELPMQLDDEMIPHNKKKPAKPAKGKTAIQDSV